MKMALAAKRMGTGWEGALIAEQKFQRALVNEKLEDLVLRGLAPLLANNYPEGTDIVIDVFIDEPKQQDGRTEPASGQ